MKREFQSHPQLSLSFTINFLFECHSSISLYVKTKTIIVSSSKCLCTLLFDFHRAINTLCPLPFTSCWLGYSLWTGKLCLMLCKVAISSLLLSLFSINYFQQGHGTVLAKICRCLL